MTTPTSPQHNAEGLQGRRKDARPSDVRMERTVLAVLDTELVLWRQYTGRLGSIQTVYKGNTIRGIGTEWKEREPYQLEILPESDRGLVMSENADVLLEIYHQASEPSGKAEFITLLLSYLSDNPKYAPVAYLILLVLFRVGQLPLTLQSALSGLRRDKAYAFSDFLRLLDALLRFEHYAFEDDWITDVNLFVDEVDGYTFRIWHRVVALKCFRFANKFH